MMSSNRDQPILFESIEVLHPPPLAPRLDILPLDAPFSPNELHPQDKRRQNTIRKPWFLAQQIRTIRLAHLQPLINFVIHRLHLSPLNLPLSTSRDHRLHRHPKHRLPRRAEIAVALFVQNLVRRRKREPEHRRDTAEKLVEERVLERVRSSREQFGRVGVLLVKVLGDECRFGNAGFRRGVVDGWTSVDGCAIGFDGARRDPSGFESPGDVGVFEPHGLVGKPLVVEGESVFRLLLQREVAGRVECRAYRVFQQLGDQDLPGMASEGMS